MGMGLGNIFTYGALGMTTSSAVAAMSFEMYTSQAANSTLNRAGRQIEKALE